MKILLVDDHPMFRMGVIRFLSGEPDVEVVGEAADGIRGLHLARTLDWDVLVLDASLPMLNGLEVLRRLRAEGCVRKIVILSHYPVDPYASRALADGADAFVSKGGDPGGLVEALRAVSAGRTWVEGGGAGAAPQVATRPHDRLTAREHQVLLGMLQGRSNIETAAELDISASTVSNHVARIKEKLGVSSRAAILKYAHEAGLVS